MALRSFRLCAAALLAGVCSEIFAEDWTRFRGPNGSGVSAETGIPTEWSDEKNLAWKVKLPGAGASSPIIIGDLVLVTSYSGYGVEGERDGRLSDLKRHLTAFDVSTGEKKWEDTVDGTTDEDPYSRMLGEHGYASSTPVSDGKRIFVFYGKAGVLAYDLSGKQLWQTNVGHESGPQRWGSGASPILYENLVVVNASEESSSLVALDQETGKVVWKAEADGLGSTWGTPILAGSGDRIDIVLGVPNEIWGINPKTGKLRWYAEALQDNSYCSSVVTDGKLVFGIEGRPGKAIAIKLGGEKDVTKTNVAWKEPGQNRICTPVLYEDRLYTVSRGVALCLDAQTGKQIYKKRLGTSEDIGDEPEARGGGRPGRFGRGGGGMGGVGGQDYSSPIVVNGKLYFVQRSGLTHVWESGPEFKLVAQNRFASDDSRFNGTPAVSHGKLWIRSDRMLYCIAKSDG
jgi:outer membrane protein assembly factor BamB